MRSLVRLSILAFSSLVACSSDPAPSPTPGTTPPGETPPGETPPSTGGDDTTISADETWADGKTIDANTTIAAGVKVEIAPGATVTVSGKFKLTIQGTLHSASTAAAHAKLTGASWSGIVIGKTGVLDVDGLDIDKPSTGLATETGGSATLLNSSLDANVPFSMDVGSKITITQSKITAKDQSTVAGTFIASYMDYGKGTTDGITLNDAQGTMTISDSKLHGAGDGDFVISSAGKLVKVEYTEITGAHCGFHFDDVGQYTIDHVSDNTNAYGAMLYGSGSGPNTITYSNFANTEYNFRMTGTNGPTTIDHTFVGGVAQSVYQNGVTPQNAPGAPNADAKPRLTK